jgi:LysM repeat protein
MLEALAIAAYIYTVKPGDNLWAISPAHNWAPVCQENHLANCNLIYPGQKLRVGGTSLTVRISNTGQSGDNDSDHDGSVRLSEPHRASFSGTLAGTLGCSGLESLWRSAGGNPGSAFIAAEIAEAESGGNQFATGPAGERGYWQIHPDHGSLSTYNAYGNARAAVIISGNGSNWSPWTTFTSGAYIGKCL